MSVEFGVWRIDGGVREVDFTPMDFEHRVETALEAQIEIASPHWMVIGRQVYNKFGKKIDLLAIDRDGNLVILELKRDQAHKEIISQLLDYGSWANEQKAEDIREIYRCYVTDHRQKNTESESIAEAFCRRFKLKEMPEELNESHSLVIVASSLDPSTERIVRYLREYHEVQINAIFFKFFRDGEREYLSRAWLTDPTIDPPEPPGKDDWNGEYYVSYNAGYEPGDRSWEDAVKFGFISGGGGPFYSRTLHLLEPGGRIWVNAPGKGYLGVGIVQEKAVIADEFMVISENGKRVPIASVREQLRNESIGGGKSNPEKAEYYVRVVWIKTVPVDDAIKEKGFFGNQNTVAKPRVSKWRSTVERLKVHFGIKD